MYKIAVMGDRDSVSGFASVGLSVFFVNTAEETERKFKEIADDDYAVIFITEKAAAFIPSEIEKYNKRQIPAVIPIPGITGNTGTGMSAVSKFVEQAVGSDILQ